ncbi:MAG: GAF domain-containing protein [Phycisphaerae bacterium]|nr:GAF domain-containing protein [Phycisphaerae bacterium]
MPTDLEILADLDRLTAMAAYNLFDSDLAVELQQICQQSAERLNMPMSAVQAVLDTATATLATNAGEADFLSAIGGAPNEFAFCPRVVIDAAPYTRADLTKDAEHDHNPAVTAGLIRSYAGVPLVLPSGHILGSHCVMASTTQTFTDADITDLSESAAQIVKTICRYSASPA